MLLFSTSDSTETGDEHRPDGPGTRAPDAEAKKDPKCNHGHC